MSALRKWIPGLSKKSPNVLVINLDFPITGGEYSLDRLAATASKKSFDGVLVKINSPGGAAGTSYDYSRLFAKIDETKPVIAYAENVCASGAYMAACGCRKLIVNPGALVGSIGALIGTVNAADLAKSWGIKPVTIRSDEHKARLSPLEPVDEKHLAPFQTTVETLRDSFIDVVAKGRGLETEQVKPYADGRIFSPHDFVEAGLADQVGGWFDALDAFEFDQKPRIKRVIKRRKGWGKRFTSDVMSSLEEASGVRSF